MNGGTKEWMDGLMDGWMDGEQSMPNQADGKTIMLKPMGGLNDGQPDR